MRNFLIYIVITSLSVLSCQKIFFNEDEGTRELILEDFHSVKISGIYDLVLIQDSTNRLVVSGSNDINSIDAIVRDDTLIIDNHKGMALNPDKNRLALHFSNLSHIVTFDPVTVSNRGTIKADLIIYEAKGEIAEVRLVIDCNNLYVFNSANTLGYFHFIGKAGSCVFWNRYGSAIFADSLISKDAEVYNESVGDVNVNASDNLKAFILGSGNICYHGTPAIAIAEKSGAGRLMKLD
jgi:hypothetical protein